MVSLSVITHTSAVSDSLHVTMNYN